MKHLKKFIKAYDLEIIKDVNNVVELITPLLRNDFSIPEETIRLILFNLMKTNLIKIEKGLSKITSFEYERNNNNPDGNYVGYKAYSKKSDDEIRNLAYNVTNKMVNELVEIHKRNLEQERKQDIMIETLELLNRNVHELQSEFRKRSLEVSTNVTKEFNKGAKNE